MANILQKAGLASDRGSSLAPVLSQLVPVDGRTVWEDEIQDGKHSFQVVDNWKVWADNTGTNKITSIYPGIIISICNTDKQYKLVCPIEATRTELEKYLQQMYDENRTGENQSIYGWLDITSIPEDDGLTLQEVLDSEGLFNKINEAVQSGIDGFQGISAISVTQNPSITTKFSFLDSNNQAVVGNTHTYYVLSSSCNVNDIQYSAGSKFVWAEDTGFVLVISDSIEERLQKVENSLSWKTLPNAKIESIVVAGNTASITITNYTEEAITVYLEKTPTGFETPYPIVLNESSNQEAITGEFTNGMMVYLKDSHGNAISDIYTIEIS